MTKLLSALLVLASAGIATPRRGSIRFNDTILFDADLVERLLAERARQPVTGKEGRRDG